MTFPIGYVLPILATAQFPENSARSVISWCLQRLDCRRGASLWYWCNLYAFKFGFETVLRSKYAMTTMLLLLLIYIYIYSILQWVYHGCMAWPFSSSFFSCAKVDLFDYQDAFGEAINGEKLIGSTVIDLEDGSGVCCAIAAVCKKHAVRLVYTNVTSSYIMYGEYRCKPYPDVNRGILGYVRKIYITIGRASESLKAQTSWMIDNIWIIYDIYIYGIFPLCDMIMINF